MNTASIKKTGLGILIGILLMIGVQSVSAWTAPSNPPVGGNVVAPVNTGSFQQFKNGTLSSLGLFTLDFGAFSQLIPTPVGISVNSSGVKIFDGVTPTPGEVLTVGANNVVSWGSALPTGTTDQTLRHNGTSWVADSLIKDGGANNRVVIGGGGTTAIPGYLNTPKSTLFLQGTTAGSTFVVSNGTTEQFKIDTSGNSGTLVTVGDASGGMIRVGSASGNGTYIMNNGKVKLADGTQGAGKILSSDQYGTSSWVTSTDLIRMVEKEGSVGDEGGRVYAQCDPGFVAIAVSCNSNDEPGPDTCQFTNTYTDLLIGSAPTNYSTILTEAASNGKYNGGVVSPTNNNSIVQVIVTCMRYQY